MSAAESLDTLRALVAALQAQNDELRLQLRGYETRQRTAAIAAEAMYRDVLRLRAEVERLRREGAGS